MDAAACIGCGACVAACPNSAAQLFTSAKLSHLNLLPQGQAERYQRTESMVDTMEDFFGSCTNHGECQEACPKEISIDFIAYMNRDYVKAQIKNRKLLSQGLAGPLATGMRLGGGREGRGAGPRRRDRQGRDQGGRATTRAERCSLRALRSSSAMGAHEMPTTVRMASSRFFSMTSTCPRK